MLFITEKFAALSMRLGVGVVAVLALVTCGGGSPSTPATTSSVATPGINLVMNADRLTGIAPLAVSLNAIGTTADTSLTTLPFHELGYKWEFSDTSDSPEWAYGPTTANRKKNLAYGPVVGHVFEKPGTWTVKLTAVATNGKAAMAEKTLTVVVTDPASLGTVCVSNTTTPEAGKAGCPVGAAAQVVTSWTGMSSLANTYKRILLKRGDVWSADGHFSLSSTQVGGIVSAYGAGTVKPKVILTSDNTAFYLNKTSDWRLVDLEISGNGVQGHSKNGITISQGSNFLISNVIISDIFIGIGSSGTIGLAIESSNISGMYDNSNAWPGIAMFIENTDNLSILGSRFSDSPATHVVRLQGTERAAVFNNHIDLAGPTRNALSIRGKTTTGAVPWSGYWTQHVVVANNVIDNSVRGGYALYVGPQSAGHAERVREVVIENNYIRGRELYGANFQVAENLTVRNNIITSYYDYVIGLGLGGNAAGSPATNGAYIYNNTLYKPSSAITNFSGFSFSSPNSANNVQIKNNIIHGVGNTRDGAGNGTGATLFALAGIVGTNFVFNGNTIDADISIVPWSSGSPSDALDFTPTGAYSAANSSTSYGTATEFSYKPVSANRTRGAINP